ncbi:hypothetical protein EMCRGX_G007433 [Ephydatia muelleri]
MSEEQKRILSENYAELVRVIQDPANLAASLFARGIISDTVMDEIQSLFVSKQKMNIVLINAVESQLLVNPSAFEVLMEVMEGEVYLSPIVKKMRAMSSSPGMSPAPGMSPSPGMSPPSPTPGKIKAL